MGERVLKHYTLKKIDKSCKTANKTHLDDTEWKYRYKGYSLVGTLLYSLDIETEKINEHCDSALYYALWKEITMH